MAWRRQDAVEPARPRRRGSPADGRGQPRGLGSTATTASASGFWIVAPAARAWPPPPNVAGEHRRVDAAGLRAHADGAWSRRPASLSSIATSAVSDWARRSMIPSEWAGIAPVAARSARRAWTR